MKSAVRWVISDGAGVDTRKSYRVRLLAVALVAAAPVMGQAQAARMRILPEVRADLTTGDVMSGQVAAGAHVSTGTYVRLVFLAGAGRAWRDGNAGDSYRFEVQTRFHLDPFRDAVFGLYGIGGVVANHDPFVDWQSRLVIGAGVDLPAHGRATWAIEAALAGGFRLSIATRHLPLGQR